MPGVGAAIVATKERGRGNLRGGGIWRLLCGARRAYAARHAWAVRAGLNGRAAMKIRAQTGLAVCLGLALACWLGAGPAAALDCSARWLGETEVAICQDAALSRTEDQVVRRVSGLARRLAFGQYLGLRHWHALWGEERGRCSLDRGCLTASYRAQIRFLDRLQQCLDTSQQRRVCFRNTLNVEREALRR
jgi:hypothetical protein